jgi:hypothetical protein
MIDPETVKYGDTFRFKKHGSSGYPVYVFLHWTEYEGDRTWAAIALHMPTGRSFFDDDRLQTYTTGFDHDDWERVE